MKKGRMAKRRWLQVSPGKLDSHRGQFAESFPLVVAVARKPELTREFRFSQPEKADAYTAELKAQALLAGKAIQPKLSQFDTSWEVRIRQRGYKATIASQLHVHRDIVRRVLAQASVPAPVVPLRPSRVDRYRPFILDDAGQVPDVDGRATVRSSW